MGYTHLTWSCPFYKSDDKCVIRCEAGRMKFFDFKAEIEYANKYCADPAGWQECTLARNCCRYYERKKDDGEKQG